MGGGGAPEAVGGGDADEEDAEGGGEPSEGQFPHDQQDDGQGGDDADQAVHTDGAGEVQDCVHAASPSSAMAGLPAWWVWWVWQSTQQPSEVGMV